jgi:hypothetical protein
MSSGTSRPAAAEPAVNNRMSAALPCSGTARRREHPADQAVHVDARI